MENNYKKRAVKELAGLKKLIQSCPASFDALEQLLSQQPLYKRTILRYDSRGEMSAYYSNMILTFHIKSGNIIIGDIVSIWDDSGTGFIGSFTAKTLQMEGSGELD